MPRSRSFTRLTMRVGLLHLGQSVDFVVSISFLRSPVFAILAIGGVFLLVGGVSAHTRSGGRLQRRGTRLFGSRPHAQGKVRRQQNCPLRNAVSKAGLAPLSLHQARRLIVLLRTDRYCPRGYQPLRL